MIHCRPDFNSHEQYATCLACAHPLDDNQRVKDAMRVATTASWAKNQLRLLAEMADDRGLPGWCVERINEIRDGIRVMP